ncbi:subclass B1 metallo-beta-lactamase [Bacillus toyonensis]|uniref:beta-lactamase n=1 Tax=Bacillus toyonensis TaxID=155322 RepID=A0A2A8HDR6_9BACI|nr:subclass B1 metallo-beta-lactamase [Bacillus toyonensis]PEQ05260.1 subclass B1 metallo-beta-lactamase [Bacillus toyonensis]
MKKRTPLKLVLCTILFSGSSLTTFIFPAQAKETVRQTQYIDQGEDISISQLRQNVWMHTSIETVKGERIPANGLVLETTRGLVLIDTPWNDTLTKELLQILKKQYPKKEVTDAIVTHAHIDRMGGIKTLIEKGVKVHSTALTADLAVQQGLDAPLGDLQNLDNIWFGDTKVETFNPGKGHTEDNITVWLPNYKILFGGCLIKSLDTKEIVQTPGSDVTNWKKVMKILEKKYNNAHLIVPGHENPGDNRLFTHTLELLKEKNNENKDSKKQSSLGR